MWLDSSNITSCGAKQAFGFHLRLVNNPFVHPTAHCTCPQKWSGNAFCMHSECKLAAPLIQLHVTRLWTTQSGVLICNHFWDTETFFFINICLLLVMYFPGSCQIKWKFSPCVICSKPLCDSQHTWWWRSLSLILTQMLFLSLSNSPTYNQIKR